MSKQQILFVDDEPLILSGLQRTLRPLRGEWDMVFVESGALALEHMAQHPFDVIISDMLMPRMNGAELLKEVLRCYPATVRMVLSGHAHQDLISQCVGVAHQFISKPCDPEELRTLVKHACHLTAGLVDGEAKQVIGSIDRLPSAPEVFLELQEALAHPAVDTRRLGAIIQRDPGMSAMVLKLVNSSFFGMRKSVQDPQEAVAYLGVDIVRSLVPSKDILEQATPPPEQALNVSRVWRHSQAVATAAQSIARLEGLPQAQQREAFTAGMLHDLGVLILTTHFPDRYDQVATLVCAEQLPLTAAEERVFGVSHAAVGAHLLGLWGLPARLLEIVSLHHQPQAFEREGMGTAMAVHVADVLCGAAEGQRFFGTPRLDETRLRRQGLLGRLEVWQAVCREVMAGEAS